MPTIYTQSCDYTAIPTQDPDTGNRTVPTITDGLFDGPSLGSTYSSSPSPPGSATITMGESSVHVGQLTSTMLYNSIFSVLDDACPPVASATECVQDKYPITGIMFRDINHQLNYGTLEVQVQSSNYTDDATQRGKLSCFRSGNKLACRNVPLTRRCSDAMIKAIASNLQASTLPANNCKIEQMDTGMMPPTAPKRWLPSFLQPRYSPGEETATLCSSVEYANVEYWKPGSTQRASDAWLTVHIDFEKPPVTPIWCGFLEDAFDIMGDAFPDLKAGSEVADDAIDILCSSGGDGKKGSHKHVRMKNGMKFSIGE